MMLIGFAFAYILSILLFHNILIISLVGTAVAGALLIIKQNSYANLLLLPIPWLLGANILTESNILSFMSFILFLIISTYLYKQYYNNSLYSLIIYSPLFAIVSSFSDNIAILVFIIVILVSLILFSWINLKKGLVTMFYYNILIFSLILGESLFDYQFINLTMIILLITFSSAMIYLTPKETSFKTFLNNFAGISIITMTTIGIFIIYLFHDLGYMIDDEHVFFIYAIYYFIVTIIIYKTQINQWLYYQFMAISAVFFIPNMIIFGSEMYNGFISTIISISLFIGLLQINKIKNIEQSKTNFFNSLFLFIIFVKLIGFDLQQVDSSIRMILLFIFSIIFIGISIYKKITSKTKKVN